MQSEGNMSLNFSVTPLGIDPETVRLEAQRLNHYATPGPLSDIKPFNMKFNMLTLHTKQCMVCHCDRLKCRPKYLNLAITNVLRKPDKLKKVSESRFCEFAGKKRKTALFTNQFLLTDKRFNVMDSKIQTEITDLKYNPAMKGKFDQLSATQNGKRMSEFGASCLEKIS